MTAVPTETQITVTEATMVHVLSICCDSLSGGDEVNDDEWITVSKKSFHHLIQYDYILSIFSSKYCCCCFSLELVEITV